MASRDDHDAVLPVRLRRAVRRRDGGDRVARRHAHATCGNPPLRVESVGAALHGRPSWDQFDDLTTMANRDAGGAAVVAHRPQAVRRADVAGVRRLLVPHDVVDRGARASAASGRAARSSKAASASRVTASCPLNTHGGQLSAGRLHGYGFLHEAAAQMWGEGGRPSDRDAARGRRGRRRRRQHLRLPPPHPRVAVLAVAVSAPPPRRSAAYPIRVSSSPCLARRCDQDRASAYGGARRRGRARSRSESSTTAPRAYVRIRQAPRRCVRRARSYVRPRSTSPFPGSFSSDDRAGNVVSDSHMRLARLSPLLGEQLGLVHSKPRRMRSALEIRNCCWRLARRRSSSIGSVPSVFRLIAAALRRLAPAGARCVLDGAARVRCVAPDRGCCCSSFDGVLGLAFGIEASSP